MASRTSLEVGPPADLQAPADIPVLSERLAEAIDRGAHHLLSLQTREGYWLGELEADTTLESDYIFYLHILGKADRTRVAKLANYIRRRQLSDGGWNIYFGGPSELNATVKAYLALKLAGDQPDAGCMERARRRVHELGGEGGAGSDEFLCALLSGAGRLRVVEHGPSRSAQNPAVAGLVSYEYLRDVVMDPRHRHSTHDLVRAQAVLAVAGTCARG